MNALMKLSTGYGANSPQTYSIACRFACPELLQNGRWCLDRRNPEGFPLARGCWGGKIFAGMLTALGIADATAALDARSPRSQSGRPPESRPRAHGRSGRAPGCVGLSAPRS